MSKIPNLPDLFEIAANALRKNPGWLDEAVEPKEASRVTKKAEATLATERCRGRGIPFIKDGVKVTYIRRRIFEYLIERERRSTSDA